MRDPRGKSSERRHFFLQHQLFLCLFQFYLRDVAARMMANARGEFDRIGQLDEIVVGPQREGFRLHSALLSWREHDDGNFLRRRVRPVESQHGEAIDLRHNQILQDDRRT